ncbi:anti-sigma F factor [Effusibacillus lacus]|uniref:Anti-sigma F factor n=1 Tax=Effusibacillus lacus TaxID=1348429 RepID=A0A292YPI6_9BACL|nr:anti-sigma F factor [Effusibacillus lacus]TCS76312.1 stage II sporulation protein AB (anti-sigma F factor) [Effusibacillus lacus]GAX91858.1 anti-sigma F factor [Effusibacillus lacus]
MARNFMKLEFPSLSRNESFARVSVAAFVSQLDPDMEELTEIKTVVSEAVTNAIIHGYEGKEGIVTVTCSLEGNRLELIVEDQGVGISDIDQARQPLFTSKPELERSGMGFTIMENFMDEIEITSELNRGTRVRLVKSIKSAHALGH